MRDETGPAGPSILEAMARKKALLLKEAAAVDKDMLELSRLAAKYNLVVSTPEEVAWTKETASTETAVRPQPVLDKNTPQTVEDLIHLYRLRPDSPFHGLTHASRVHYDALLSIIMRDHGSKALADLHSADIVEWHLDWGKGGTHAIAHAKFGMVRGLMGFGTEILHDNNCERLCGAISKLKFKAPEARTERLSLAHANDIRTWAHKLERPSIALAQAFQSGTGLLQKDIIGEWLPVSEPGMSEITSGPLKWMRGIRWSEIDDNLVLRHSSARWIGDVEIRLRDMPMVMDEFRIQFGFDSKGERGNLPPSGPIIESEWDGLPWTAPEFRRWWRKVANAAGVPPNVKNMDSRTRAKDGEESEDEERRVAK